MAENSWHLDKRVPITLIAALVVQTGGFIYWAGQLSTRVGHLEETLARTENRGERISRLEAAVESVQRVLVRIEHKLDRLK